MHHDKTDGTKQKSGHNHHEPRWADEYILGIGVCLTVILDSLCDVDNSYCWHIFEIVCKLTSSVWHNDFVDAGIRRAVWVNSATIESIGDNEANQSIFVGSAVVFDGGRRSEFWCGDKIRRELTSD